MRLSVIPFNKTILGSLLVITLLTGCSSSNRGGAFYQQKPFRYQVDQHDTIGSVSQRYGLTQQQLARANNLQSPYILKRGQWLTIPGKATYVVQSGDTLYGIAKRFNTSIAALVQVNKLSSPNNIYPGQRINVVTSNYVSSDNKTIASKPQSTPAAKKAVPKVKPQELFYKPVAGNILVKYGTQGSGQKNDGINIGVALGTPVKAAQSGTIAYAGNEIRGFGNLVLIKHQISGIQWISTYAHLNKIDVKKGQTVSARQQIGAVGMTGSVKNPQLYFELRQGKKAVDPILYLK